MLFKFLGTVWTIITEIVYGIDIKLKHEKTPQERIMWWAIILAVTIVVVFFSLQALGNFVSSLVNESGGEQPTETVL